MAKFDVQAIINKYEIYFIQGEIVNISKLYKAIDRSNIKFIDKKFREGIPVDSADSEGLTLFHYAIYKRNQKMASWLLEKGADIDSMDINEYTPIITACENGYLDMVKFLVSNNCKLRIYGHYQPMHISACFGFNEIIEYLLENGMDINEKDREGTSYTPLHWAVQEGMLETVKLLIVKGAEVNTHDDLFFISPLRTAVGEGYIDIVKVLLQNGAYVEGYIECDDSPLSAASSKGYLEIVKLLLKYGADIDWQDSDGRTALFYAKLNIDCKTEKVIDYLIEKGADIFTVDKYGYSFKHLEDPIIREKIKNEV